MDSTVVMYDDTTKQIADGMLDGIQCRLSATKWDRYPDGLPKMFVNQQQDLAAKDVVYVTALSDCETALRVAIMVRHLNNCHVRSLSLIVTAYMFGTDDRADRPGMVVTGKHVIGIIEDSMQAAKGIPQSIFMCEPHTYQLLEYNRSSMHCIDIMPSMLKHVLNEHCSSTDGPLCVVMPDNGADKRYNMIVANIPQLSKIVCNKVRGADGIVKTTILENHTDRIRRPTGYVIIDDIVRSGSTLIQCYQAIREIAGPKPEISVAIVHADFVGDAVNRIHGSEIRRFYISDSNPRLTATVTDVTPFIVVPVAPVIVSNIVGNK